MQEKILFQEEKAAWTTYMTAQKTKQAMIRRGAAIMFRTNRIEAQQEKEEREKAMHALESGLLQTAQQELEYIDQEHAETIANLLVATAAQITCAAASLEAKVRANAISDRLTNVLDRVYDERQHIQQLSDEVNVKSAELDVLICNAKADRTKAHEYRHTAQAQVSRFSLAAEAIGLVQGQVESTATEDRERLSKTLAKERGEALEEARSETQKRLAALRDARTAFEKLREVEKANLAKGYARVEHSRAIVDMEKELVKKEMVRARLLAIKAEQERAASVDAKKAALEELQAARLMRDSSRRALHKLVAIADGMVIPKATSDKVIKDVTSTTAGGDVRADLAESLKCRIRRRVASQGHMNGATSCTTDGMKGGIASGLQKRCTSLDITRADGSRSSIPSPVPRSQALELPRSETEDSEHSTGVKKVSNLTDPPISELQKSSLKGSIKHINETVVPIRNERDISPINGKTTKEHTVDKRLESSEEKCDKQPNRMKLGNIGNTAY